MVCRLGRAVSGVPVGLSESRCPKCPFEFVDRPNQYDRVAAVLVEHPDNPTGHEQGASADHQADPEETAGDEIGDLLKEVRAVGGAVPTEERVDNPSCDQRDAESEEQLANVHLGASAGAVDGGGQVGQPGAHRSCSHFGVQVVPCGWPFRDGSGLAYRRWCRRDIGGRGGLVPTGSAPVAPTPLKGITHGVSSSVPSEGRVDIAIEGVAPEQVVLRIGPFSEATGSTTRLSYRAGSTSTGRLNDLS